MNPLDVTVNYSFDTQTIHLKDTTFEQIAQFFDKQHVEFVKKAQIVHRKTVFQILRFLLRICPVDTGRLRGSFTPIMDKYGDTKYQQWIADSSMAPSERVTPKKGFDPQEADKGKSQGQFIDEPMSTTIITNVEYASYVDQKTGYINRMLTYGSDLYNRNFERFWDAAVEQGMVPEVDPNVDEGGF